MINIPKTPPKLANTLEKKSVWERKGICMKNPKADPTIIATPTTKNAECRKLLKTFFKPTQKTLSTFAITLAIFIRPNHIISRHSKPATVSHQSQKLFYYD